MATILNLTPHAVNLLDAEGNTLAVFPPTGTIARAAQQDQPVGKVEAEGVVIAVVQTTYGEPADLPAPAEDTFYVVSILTAQAAKAYGRDTSDLLVTSGPVRDETGRIIGCRQFAVV